MNVAPTPTPKGNPLAIAALVVGILAALVCWIPLLGIVAIPTAVVAILLGAPALVMAYAWQRSGKAPAIAGLALSVGAIWMTYQVTRATSEALRAAVAERPKPAAKFVAATVAGAEAAPRREPIVTPEPEADPDAGWIVAPAAAQLGDVAVRIAEARIGQVALKERVGRDKGEVSADPLLSITVEVTNLGETRKVDYMSWSEGGLISTRNGMTLADNFGNTYRRVNFGIFTFPEGRFDAGSIYPGKSISDVLTFEVPIDTAKNLDLVLPGESAGVEGVFRFRIPIAMISRFGSVATPQPGAAESPPPGTAKRIDFAVSVLPGRKVRIEGTTSLPVGTNLVASIERHDTEGVLARSEASVSRDGSFKFEPIAISASLAGGAYVANVKASDDESVSVDYAFTLPGRR